MVRAAAENPGCTDTASKQQFPLSRAGSQ